MNVRSSFLEDIEKELLEPFEYRGLKFHATDRLMLEVIGVVVAWSGGYIENNIRVPLITHDCNHFVMVPLCEARHIGTALFLHRLHVYSRLIESRNITEIEFPATEELEESFTHVPSSADRASCP